MKKEKSIDKVNFLNLLRSLQRRLELDDHTTWYLCEKGQPMWDFCEMDVLIRAQFDSIVTHTPLKSWQSGRDYKWYCRLYDSKRKRYVYFTAIEW